MVIVRPFAAYYYNTKKVRLDDVVVPPFDVISESERKFFFKRHRCNFAKVILGKDKNNGYKRGGRLFRKWKKEGILIHDSSPHFYLWQQTFKQGRRTLTRSGLVAAVALNGFQEGEIVPHEKTFEAPILDRLQIVEETRANLSPVFMMYDGKQMTLEKKMIRHLLNENFRKPFLQFQDLQGVKSKIWKIQDSALEEEIQNYFQRKKLYIVDGHHRFATALAFRKKCQGRSNHSLDFVLCVISNMSDPGLVVYPIHRMLMKQKKFDAEGYLKSLERYFVISKKKGPPGMLKRHHWGVLFYGDAAYYELSLKKTVRLEFLKKIQADKPLDVSILQELIIPKSYHQDLRYTKSVGKGLEVEFEKLREGKYEAIWLVREPTLNQIKKIADAHEVMPQKSTFFYPKVFAGPLIRCFNEGSEFVCDPK